MATTDWFSSWRLQLGQNNWNWKRFSFLHNLFFLRDWQMLVISSFIFTMLHQSHYAHESVDYKKVNRKMFWTVQLIFGVIIEKLRGLIWDLWDSCIDGRARLRRSEGEKRTQVEQTQSGCTNEIGVKRRNFQQYTLTSVKLKKSPMLPTNRSTSPAYCSMMCEHEVQDNGCLWKQLWEDEEEEESWENVRRWWNSGSGWKTKLKQTNKKTPTAAQVPLGLT